MSKQIKIVAVIGAILIACAVGYLLFAGSGDEPDAQERGVTVDTAVDSAEE